MRRERPGVSRELVDQSGDDTWRAQRARRVLDGSNASLGGQDPRRERASLGGGDADVGERGGQREDSAGDFCSVTRARRRGAPRCARGSRGGGAHRP